MLFPTCMSFFLLFNINKDILKNGSNQSFAVAYFLVWKEQMEVKRGPATVLLPTFVMWRSTPRLRSLYQNNETSHIEALYRSLIRFAKSTWSVTSEASFTWKPRDCFISGSNEANLSAVSFTLHYIAFALFSFYHNLYIKVKWTLPMK